MLSSDQQRLVEQATVTLPGLGARGVLIPGQMILTAAHCVTYTTDGAMVLGDDFIEGIITASGATLKAKPVFLDPMADIALLGVLDNQVFGHEVDAYEAWCAQTTPIGLCEDDFPYDTPIPVAVYTHLGHWISGTVRQMRYEADALASLMTSPIVGGTSGSPLLTTEGLIVGVVSHTPQEPADMGVDVGVGYASLTPRPHLTLPVWAMHQIHAQADREQYEVDWRAWYGFTE